jgi:1-phosphofructokinase family hexose kinase
VPDRHENAAIRGAEVFLTVTANAALDRILFIQRFEPATTMRTFSALDAVGGKGYDVSVALRCLGLETLAVGFAAGDVGHALEGLLAGYGMQMDLVWTSGETRIAHVIIENELHRHSHIITRGPAIAGAEYQALLKRVLDRLEQAQWLIAAGSLPDGVPEDFYQLVTQMAHEHGIPVLIDTPGNPARLAISACPEIMKMNWQEFARTFEVQAVSPEKLEDDVRRIVRLHELNSLVITCGAEGVFAITPEGEFWARPPQQQAVNAAGAGDAASAALVWRLTQGDTWEQALQWAAAAGAATVLTAATAECELQEVQRIYPLVDIQEISP